MRIRPIDVTVQHTISVEVDEAQLFENLGAITKIKR